jgi:hypothetical protein
VKQPTKTCRDCRLRALAGTCTEPKAAGLAERFILVWAPTGHAEQCKAFRPTANYLRRQEAATA